MLRVSVSFVSFALVLVLLCLIAALFNSEKDTESPKAPEKKKKKEEEGKKKRMQTYTKAERHGCVGTQ